MGTGRRVLCAVPLVVVLIAAHLRYGGIYKAWRLYATFHGSTGAGGRGLHHYWKLPFEPKEPPVRLTEEQWQQEYSATNVTILLLASSGFNAWVEHMLERIALFRL